MNIAITIDRESVLGVVEGLTATISQHNAGVPSYDQLWASDAESPKLDIWWREGITDLEANLKKWATATSSLFIVQAVGNDLSLTLDTGQWWDDKLTGLLKNKVQQYMVHVVMAGWLSDFEGVHAPDYKGIAASDLMGIANILLYKDLAFTEEERTADVAKGTADQNDMSADARTADVPKWDDAGGVISEDARTADKPKDETDADAIGEAERTADTPKGGVDGDTITEDERTADVPKADMGGDAIGEEARTADTPKDGGSGGGITEDERATDVAKDAGCGDLVAMTTRNRDNVTDGGSDMQMESTERDKDDRFHQPLHSTSWSGEGVGVPAKKHPCRCHPFWKNPFWRH